MLCALLKAKSPKMVRQRDPCAREMTQPFGKETESLAQASGCSAPLVRSVLLEVAVLVSSVRGAGRLHPGVC